MVTIAATAPVSRLIGEKELGKHPAFVEPHFDRRFYLVMSLGYIQIQGLRIVSAMPMFA